MQSTKVYFHLDEKDVSKDTSVLKTFCTGRVEYEDLCFDYHQHNSDENF